MCWVAGAATFLSRFLSLPQLHPSGKYLILHYSLCLWTFIVTAFVYLKTEKNSNESPDQGSKNREPKKDSKL